MRLQLHLRPTKTAKFLDMIKGFPNFLFSKTASAKMTPSDTNLRANSRSVMSPLRISAKDPARFAISINGLIQEGAETTAGINSEPNDANSSSSSSSSSGNPFHIQSVLKAFICGICTLPRSIFDYKPSF